MTGIWMDEWTIDRQIMIEDRYIDTQIKIGFNMYTLNILNFKKNRENRVQSIF